MEPDDGLAELLATRVAFAEDPFDVIVWDGVEYAADSSDSDFSDAAIIERVWRLADQHFAAHLEAQRSWPAQTDSDRLTAAFRDLDRAHIVARENFTCCQNCGHAEIGDEFSPSQKPRGYVFYHQQDAERGTEGQGVYLAYDGFDQTAIGQEIVAALRARGLDPQWNGSANSRIQVPLTWQRRRLGRLAAHPGMLGATDFEFVAEPLDGWNGPAPIGGGATSARAWAALRLPWLPKGNRIRFTTTDGATVVVHREWDRLIGTFSDGQAVTARTDAWVLMSRLAGTAPAEAREPGQEQLLDVSFEHRGGVSAGAIPMTVQESEQVVARMPVRTGSWATYTSRSGTVVQAIWRDGPKLWMELRNMPDRCSHGRPVTIAEAQQVVRALAETDRVILQELGPLVTQPW